MTKETVGKIASELQMETPSSLDPVEIQRATEKEYLYNLEWCVRHAIKDVDCSAIEGHDVCKDRPAMEGDFYVAALIKKEKLLSNVIRNYFIPTYSCPTPHFDQAVYKFNKAKGDIQFLWVVPDEETSLTLMENKDIVVPNERHLLQFVIDYYNGTLFNIAKKLNGETIYAGSALIVE